MTHTFSRFFCSRSFAPSGRWSQKNIRPKKDPNKVRKRKNKKERERSKQLNNTNTAKPEKVENTITKLESVKVEKKVKHSDKSNPKLTKTNGHI